ncbi:methionyl-tRNA formyltransferase [Peptoniphilus sp. KCTC 25270]|uniref:methionyl-tRNA formyltransferase n=1 Tax=Peptoniphilus sp. KCTC 25270 TaxID=2897414 RepID=UPI001E341C20|nr:methionyl-tRNA formyltransferase [Peptoniphilus sp. KCTC 25270]
MKCVFFGTPDFAIAPLKALAEKVDVTLVVTQEDKQKGRGKKLQPTPVKMVAEELGIEVFQPKNINDPESIEYLKKQEADLFVVVAYGQILKQDVLDIPKLYPINIHGSILPKYRGAAPIQHAILEGEETTGISIMKMELGLDSGPVALEKHLEIGDMDTGELFEAVSHLGAEGIVEFVSLVEEGKVHFQEQNHEESTYADKIHPSMGVLDFYNEEAPVLKRKIQGFSPKPGAKFSVEGSTFKVFASEIVEKTLNPGAFQVEGKKLYIGTKKGALSLLSIQREGKKRMDIAAFLAGNPLGEKGFVDRIEG